MKSRFNRSISISILLSLLLHASFFVYAHRVWIRGVIEKNVDFTKKLFDVKLVEEKKPPIRSIILKSTMDKTSLRFVNPSAESIKLATGEVTAEDIEKEMEQGIQSDLQPQESLINFPEKQPSDYSPDTELQEKKRAVRGSISEQPSIPVVRDTKLPEFEETVVPKEFTEKMPGFTPIEFNPDKPGESLLKNMLYGEQGSKYTGLDQYLLATLLTYKDPSDGKKYFKIILTAGKDVDKLKVIPKEILFLVDCSLSTQPERMESFKKGLLYCLNNLNKEDIFNVISFKDVIQRLNAKSLQPDSKAIKVSGDFISSLMSSETTDVYRAFAEVIKTPPERHPSYIVLLSDGRPSVGIMDSREIISNINRINKETRSIFCYSAGARVNRYLLDFIAYRNRGWSEYSYRSYDVIKGLQVFYNKIKDPILLNLRYRFSQLSSDEIYPKSLPDFYKGAAFTIFGTYEDEDEFSMQLLGESKENAMEFIFSDSLKKAPAGDAEIARQWAFNKIYFLIGKLAEEKDSQQIIQEINNLCKKFNIKTPYSYDVR